MVLSASVLRQRTSFPADSFASVQLGVSFPIYDGGSSAAKKAKAQAAKRQAVLQQEFLRKQIRAEIVKSDLNLNAIRKSREALEKQVELVRNTYSDVRQFYGVGEATDLDVRDTYLQLIDSERKLANLTTDEVLAHFKMRRDLGLLPIDLVEEN